MNRSDIYPLFLELLVSAIRNRPVKESLFENVSEETWSLLVRYAGIQRVNALIADGVAKLPEVYAPPRSLAVLLLLHAEKIEAANRELNRVLTEIVREHEAADLPFVLLKGQGNALYYPNPLHRTPGDLDLYFYRQGDYERAKKQVIEKRYPLEEESIKHQGYNRGAVHIENHKTVEVVHLKKIDKKLQRKVKEITDKENFEIIRINETPIRVLPIEFNALYLFIHLFHHFVYFGVGMRQICDWVLYLSARHAEIDKKKFTETALEFHLLRPMRVFAHATVKYLEIPPEIFPFELGEYTPYSDLVMNDILDGGHFGFYRSGKKRPAGKWSGRWFSFRHAVQRSWVYASIAPSYIFTMPIYKFSTRLKLTLKGFRC
jgi:hypothetical protein